MPNIDTGQDYGYPRHHKYAVKRHPRPSQQHRYNRIRTETSPEYDDSLEDRYDRTIV